MNDDNINMMGLTQPKTLDYLNFREATLNLPQQYSPQVFTVTMSLAKKVIIQKRSVYNMMMLFGDVGGLYDFFVVAIAMIFGFVSERFMLASVLPKLFHQIKLTKEQKETEIINQIKPLSFPFSFLILYACSCSSKKKAFKLGKEKL